MFNCQHNPKNWDESFFSSTFVLHWCQRSWHFFFFQYNTFSKCLRRRCWLPYNNLLLRFRNLRFRNYRRFLRNWTIIPELFRNSMTYFSKTYDNSGISELQKWRFLRIMTNNFGTSNKFRNLNFWDSGFILKNLNLSGILFWPNSGI